MCICKKNSKVVDICKKKKNERTKKFLNSEKKKLYNVAKNICQQRCYRYKSFNGKLIGYTIQEFAQQKINDKYLPLTNEFFSFLHCCCCFWCVWIYDQSFETFLSLSLSQRINVWLFFILFSWSVFVFVNVWTWWKFSLSL